MLQARATHCLGCAPKQTAVDVMLGARILATATSMAQAATVWACKAVLTYTNAAADFYMSGYNVAFSLLPPLLIGIMDQDVDRGHASKYPGMR